MTMNIITIVFLVWIKLCKISCYVVRRWSHSILNIMYYLTHRYSVEQFKPTSRSILLYKQKPGCRDGPPNLPYVEVNTNAKWSRLV